MSVLVDAVSVSRPPNASGSPSAWRSQPTTTVSSSVPIGEVRHSIGFWPSPAVRNSPSIPAPDADVAKYARNPGCCQWVALGKTRRSTSSRIASSGSGASGAAAGKAAAMDPGSTGGRTAYVSMSVR